VLRYLSSPPVPFNYCAAFAKIGSLALPKESQQPRNVYEARPALPAAPAHTKQKLLRWRQLCVVID
jgi:hypothetical protein